MLTEKTIRAVTCCRCGKTIRELPAGEEYQPPAKPAILLGGQAVEAIYPGGRAMVELCPLCTKAVVDPIRRLLRLPQEKKAKGEPEGK